jgi:septum formation protein
MTRERPLVLGSGSPYRRALLRRLGLAFEVIVPGIPEGHRDGEPPASVAHRLALEKARAVAGRAPQSLVIGCDQVAEVEGRGLGKPLDRPRNVAQLTLLSGTRVAFRSGLCLLDAATGRVQSEVVDTFVTFRTLTAAEIEAYVDREHALDCAGGFRCEGLGIALVESIRGNDPTALEGLPLIALTRMLRTEGLNPLS